MYTAPYSASDSHLYHFYQHARMGLSPTIERFGHEKNWIESVGNLGLWTLENLPGKMWRLMKEPRWITLVLSKISLIGVTFLFYPKYTQEMFKAVIVKIPLPSQEQVKFAAYVTIVFHIIAATIRAFGRFHNTPMMNAWYANGNAPAPVASPVAAKDAAVLDAEQA